MVLNVEADWKMEKDQFCESGGPCEWAKAPAALWWTPFRTGYGPGVLIGRVGKLEEQCPTWVAAIKTLARLTFIAPDGTETELRDEQSNGEPHVTPTCSLPPPHSRGAAFKSFDGSALTFISDSEVLESENAGVLDSLSGYLLFPSGLRYRISDGLVQWIRDRNGNLLEFQYDAMRRVTLITDATKRQIQIAYYVNNCPVGGGHCDEITYKGTGGQDRLIRVRRSGIQQYLEPPYLPKSKQELW